MPTDYFALLNAMPALWVAKEWPIGNITMLEISLLALEKNRNKTVVFTEDSFPEGVMTRHDNRS